MFLKKLFQKKKKKRAEKKKRSKYRVTVDSENLAFPEIHIKPSGAGHADDIDDKSKNEEITYDNVAIPEVHIRNRRRKK